ncbi:MAG: tetratricopeptide repeat protein, partial [Planctomycetia bacterium]
TAVMVVVAADLRTRAVARRMANASAALVKDNAPAAARIAPLAARAKARPLDSDAQVDLAQALLAAAADDVIASGMAVVGPAALFNPPETFSPDELRDGRAGAGLRAARAARAACPLNAKSHYLLGLYADSFASSEPSLVHLSRAKTLLVVDPFIWYRVGKEAYGRGDFPTAWENWKGSIAHGPRFVPRIVRAARLHLSPAEINGRLLPDHPVAIMLAVDTLYPDRLAAKAERRPFLDRALTTAVSERPGGPGDRIVSARAAEEIGDVDKASAIWQRAVADYPRDWFLRNAYIQWLFSEELYAEAVPHCTVLLKSNPRDPRLAEQLGVAKHGEKLAKTLKPK